MGEMYWFWSKIRSSKSIVLQGYDHKGYQKSFFQKNSPEMNELERDLTPVKFLASNFEKQKKLEQF